MGVVSWMEIVLVGVGHALWWGVRFQGGGNTSVGTAYCRGVDMRVEHARGEYVRARGRMGRMYCLGVNAMGRETC